MLEACGVRGFMENHAELFEMADSDGEAWRQLVDRWEEQYPTAPVTAGDLFALAVDVDGFPIEGNTEHGQRIAFGRALAKQNDRVFDDRRIVREMDKKKHGAKYRLQVGERGISGNKGNVPAALHARDLQLFPYGDGPQNIPNIPDIPPYSPVIPPDLSTLELPSLKSLARDLAAFIDGSPPHPEQMPDLEPADRRDRRPGRRCKMTPETAARSKRMNARLKDWYNAPREKMREFLGLLPWQNSEVIEDFDFYLEHMRNLLWCYTTQTETIRAETTDPHIHFEASFALAMDDMRDPIEDEEELRDMRGRAWAGIMKKAAEKQQREAGNAN